MVAFPSGFLGAGMTARLLAMSQNKCDRTSIGGRDIYHRPLRTVSNFTFRSGLNN